MYRYTAERRVARPLENVFRYLADVAKQTEWVQGVSDCHWTGPGPVRVGSVAEQSMTFMGKLRILPLALIQYNPPLRLRFEKTEPFLIRFGFELEGDGSATLVRYPVEMDPRGLFRIIIPLVGKRTID